MQTAQQYRQNESTEQLDKTKRQTLTIIIALLVLLWSYTAGSKLIDLQEFKRELFNQTFSKHFATILLWFIPITEITAAILLIIQRTRLLGLIFSMILMSIFTGYISLVLLDYYDRVPCSCGGVLKQLGWEEHFYFNLFFLSLSLIGIFLHQHNLKKTNRLKRQNNQ